jgi:hypothetical protein
VGPAFLVWFTVLIGIVMNNRGIDAINKRMDAPETHVNKRIDDLRANLVARIEALEKRLVDRIERLEHAVIRP